MDGLSFSTLDQLSARWLERPFIEEEVGNVSRGMAIDKASGLDGFTLGFFQVC